MSEEVKLETENEIPEELKLVAFKLSYTTKDGNLTEKTYYLPQVQELLKEMFNEVMSDPNLGTLQVTSEVPGCDINISFFLDENEMLVNKSALNFSKDNPIAYLQGFYNYVTSTLLDFSKAMAMTMDGMDEEDENPPTPSKKKTLN